MLVEAKKLVVGVTMSAKVRMCRCFILMWFWRLTLNIGPASTTQCKSQTCSSPFLILTVNVTRWAPTNIPVPIIFCKTREQRIAALHLPQVLQLQRWQWHRRCARLFWFCTSSHWWHVFCVEDGKFSSFVVMFFSPIPCFGPCSWLSRLALVLFVAHVQVPTKPAGSCKVGQVGWHTSQFWVTDI